MPCWCGAFHHGPTRATRQRCPRPSLLRAYPPRNWSAPGRLLPDGKNQRISALSHDRLFPVRLPTDRIGSFAAIPQGRLAAEADHPRRRSAVVKGYQMPAADRGGRRRHGGGCLRLGLPVTAVGGRHLITLHIPGLFAALHYEAHSDRPESANSSHSCYRA